jgi:hypothetical protein
MIRFVKKTEPQPSTEEAGDDRFKKIREAAADGHKKAANDSTRRPTPQASEDDERLI